MEIDGLQTDRLTFKNLLCDPQALSRILGGQWRPCLLENDNRTYAEQLNTWSHELIINGVEERLSESEYLLFKHEA